MKCQAVRPCCFNRVSRVRIFSLLMLVTIVAGCALPQHMEVRAGTDPRHQDDGVRFRTTYYFRVFDVCGSGFAATAAGDRQRTADGLYTNKSTGPYEIKFDSIYRFRMTGKANALGSKIHFESGTLKASQIDPFGATVNFDQESGRFALQSRRTTEQRVEQEHRRDELKRLRTLYGDLAALLPKDARASAYQRDVSELLKAVNARMLALIGPSGSSHTTPGTRTSNGPSSRTACPGGKLARRGFQVLGPEGWRTFDQDERLIMAMSSSGAPVIGVLQELSSRVLAERAPASERLLPLVREQLNIQRGVQALESRMTDSTVSAEAAIKAAIREYSPQ